VNVRERRLRPWNRRRGDCRRGGGRQLRTRRRAGAPSEKESDPNGKEKEREPDPTVTGGGFELRGAADRIGRKSASDGERGRPRGGRRSDTWHRVSVSRRDHVAPR